jgi:hypothetical protein
MKPKPTKYLYVTYDGRYRFDEDKAAVMETSDNLEEAQDTRIDYGDDCVIVRYEIAPGDKLINPEVQPNETEPKTTTANNREQENER